MGEKVVVAGGGIAGLEIALRLEKKDFEVVLLDPRDEMFFYPTAHRVLEGGEAETIPYEEKFSDREIEHIQEKMTGLEDGKVKAGSRELDFDYLAICTGAKPNFYGLKPQKTMMNLKELEKIAEGSGPAVVVGGGATGVEASASLSKTREVTLVEAENRILPRMTEKASKKAAKTLESQGVKVKTGERVEKVDGETVKTSENVYRGEVLWCAGIKKSDLVSKLDLPQDRKGLKVDEYNRVKGRRAVFAAGDCCSYPGKEARALHAIVEAKTVAKNIKASESRRRSFKINPQLVYLGGKALLEWRGLVFTGKIPHLLERYVVEERYLYLRRNFL